MSKAKVFRGGVPYAIDVKRLSDAFPVPSLTEGRVIKHSQLEEIVCCTRGTQRYYSVINSWLKQVKNTNGLFIVWESTIGIKVLDPADTLTFSETRLRQKIGQTGRAVRNFNWVDRNRLDPIGQQRYDHQSRVASAIADSLKSARKEMAISLAPIASLPRPKIIREA